MGDQIAQDGGKHNLPELVFGNGHPTPISGERIIELRDGLIEE
jgi:hypothetical protein